MSAVCNCCVLLTSLANNGMLTEKEDVTGQKVLTPIMTLLDGDNWRLDEIGSLWVFPWVLNFEWFSDVFRPSTAGAGGCG